MSYYDDSDLESMINAYLRVAASRFRETERIGPFLATFDPHNSNPFLNYAIPDDSATPAADDVRDLTVAYERRGRRPRLEYIPGAAPAVEAVLRAGGFSVERRVPLMTCSAGDERPVPSPAGTEVLAPVTDEDFLGMGSAQGEAYGSSSPPDPRQVAVWRDYVVAGGIYVLARDSGTGRIVGGGLADIPHAGMTEISSIGVVEPYRRRGIAGAMTSWLAQHSFATGVQAAWVTPDNEALAEIYARAGFIPKTTALHISLA